MSLHDRVELLQGTLDLIVLQALSTMGPLHAYALAARLDMLLGNPALMAEIAEGGFIRCRDHFSVEAVGAQLLDCYSAALEGKS